MSKEVPPAFAGKPKKIAKDMLDHLSELPVGGTLTDPLIGVPGKDQVKGLDYVRNAYFKDRRERGPHLYEKWGAIPVKATNHPNVDPMWFGQDGYMYSSSSLECLYFFTTREEYNKRQRLAAERLARPEKDEAKIEAARD